LNNVEGGDCRGRILYLVVGLGNPGSQYRDTRHNAGFKVIESWSRKLEADLIGSGLSSNIIQAKVKGKRVLLLCPSTYMNHSGKAVKACVDEYNLEIERILVVHDDLDLPVGRVKVVRGGGPGGHRGIESIIHHLHSKNFARIKLGIGRPRYGEGVEEYVLALFYSDEREISQYLVRVAVSACELFVLEGVEKAMNRINCLSLDLIKEE
jgi:PTH1 family peptidyl-tRNA hydrolase